jgi:sirohydrochlorin ferrochelatase
MRHPYLRSADRTSGHRRPAPRAAWPPLVAVAHGSSDPRAGSAIADLIAQARARAELRGPPGLDARAAFLGHAAPALPQVLAALHGAGRRRVVVLPLLLTAAYHSGTDIPGALREAQAAFPRLSIAYGEPLGPHPALLHALERRLAEADGGADAAANGGAAGDYRVSSTAVVLAAAGSSRPAANAAVAQMAADWQAARGWRAVLPAYASAASPTPDQAVAALLRDGAQRVVVASYLLAPGLFADRIRDASLAAGAAAVSRPLGAAPEVADVLLQRYTEAWTTGASSTMRASARPAS